MVVGRKIVVAIVLVLAVFASACRGGPTAPTESQIPGIISSITLATLNGVEPSPPPSGNALSYVYGVDTVTARVSVTINSADMNPNLVVMACLGVDTESYISGGCRGRGPGAISEGVIYGVTLDPAYSSGRSLITSTKYLHVFVLKTGMLNDFYASLTQAERDRVPLAKLREVGLLLSEPKNVPEPIDWRTP